mmetsp:Transcript_15759/g.36280  ORF Transcript_15759/g.36280 Transcript_15759/m.36280 type:complete len:113 (+) Transcript_15759:2130-2468(+)
MDLDVHVVTKSQDNLLNLARQLTGRSQDQGLAFLDRLVNDGKTSDGESGGFTLGKKAKRKSDKLDRLSSRRALSTQSPCHGPQQSFASITEAAIRKSQKVCFRVVVSQTLRG